MYEHVIGISESVDKPEQNLLHSNSGMIQATVDYVLAQAWEQAARTASIKYGLSDEEISRRMNQKEMLAMNVPKQHQSFDSNDLVRGFICTMIDGEIKLLAGYAINY